MNGMRLEFCTMLWILQIRSPLVECPDTLSSGNLRCARVRLTTRMWFSRDIIWHGLLYLNGRVRDFIITCDKLQNRSKKKHWRISWHGVNHLSDFSSWHTYRVRFDGLFKCRATGVGLSVNRRVEPDLLRLLTHTKSDGLVDSEKDS